MAYTFEQRRRDTTLGYLKSALSTIADGKTPYHFESPADYAEATLKKAAEYLEMTEAEWNAAMGFQEAVFTGVANELGG